MDIKVHWLCLVLLATTCVSSMTVLMAVAIVWPLCRSASILITLTAVTAPDRLLLIFLICPPLAELRQGLEATEYDSTTRGINGMIVSIASIVLPAPVLSSSKLIDRVLRGVDTENSLHYSYCLFALEHTAIGMIDGVVLDFSSGKGGSREQMGQVPLVTGMRKAHEKAQA